MRLILLATMIVSCALTAAAEQRIQGQAELGAFYYGVDERQPNWVGQRLVTRAFPFDRFTGQLEIVNAERGNDTGQQAGLAAWMDWSEHLFTVANVSVSNSAPFFPDWRADGEFHLKLPGLESLVPFAGGGFVRFDDADTWLATSGVTYWFPWLGGGSLGYRFTRFESDFDASSLRASDGRSNSHRIDLTMNRADSMLGQLKLAYLYGDDKLRDFSIVPGTSEDFVSNGVYVAWRRRWMSRLGTHLQFEWERNRELFDRMGVEFRFVWYFGRPSEKWD